MSDENDAREWLDKNGYDNPRMTKYNKPDGENNPSLSDVLTAYAAAVTQERDALRPLLEFFVNSRNVIVPAIACHFGEETIKICGCNGCILQRRFKDAKAVLDTYPTRAAAEESQPK